MVSGGRSPTPVKTQAECAEPFAPTVSLVIGIIFACSVRGAFGVRKEVKTRVHAQQGDERNLNNLCLCHFPTVIFSEAMRESMKNDGHRDKEEVTAPILDSERMTFGESTN